MFIRLFYRSDLLDTLILNRWCYLITVGLSLHQKRLLVDLNIWSFLCYLLNSQFGSTVNAALNVAVQLSCSSHAESYAHFVGQGYFVQLMQRFPCTFVIPVDMPPTEKATSISADFTALNFTWFVVLDEAFSLIFFPHAVCFQEHLDQTRC
jgi:hypothetical protein